MSCYYCRYARQVANRKVTDVVGCPLIANDSKLFNESEGQLYEGWYYAHREPGDVSDEDNIPTRGLLNKGILIDASGSCQNFDDTGVIYEHRFKPTIKEESND